MTYINKNKETNLTKALQNEQSYSQKFNSLKHNIERYNQVIDDDLYDNSGISYLKTAGYIAEDLALSIRNQIILQEQYLNNKTNSNTFNNHPSYLSDFFKAEQFDNITIITMPPLENIRQKSEKQMCGNKLLYDTLSEKLRRKFISRQLKTYNITIITMPPLENIRQKSEKQMCGNKLLYDTLSEKLRRKFISRQLKTYKTKVVLAIFNVVSDENMEFQIPDTDNRNYHPIINIVKEFFISDDNYNNVSLYLDTIKLNTISKTVMFIIPIEKINTSCNSVVTMIQNYLYPNNSNNKIIKIDKNFRTNNVKNAVV